MGNRKWSEFCTNIGIDTRYYMYWITAAKSNLDTRKAIVLPLNSVFKISDIVKYNFFPTCSITYSILVVDRLLNT